MGIYLNEKRAFSLFQEDCAMTYYIDKTEMLDEIVRILEQNCWYILAQDRFLACKAEE